MTNTQQKIASALRRKLRKLGLLPEQFSGNRGGMEPRLRCCPLYEDSGLGERTIRRALNFENERDPHMTWDTAERLCVVVGWSMLDALEDEKRWQEKLELMRRMAA